MLWSGVFLFPFYSRGNWGPESSVTCTKSCCWWGALLKTVYLCTLSKILCFLCLRVQSLSHLWLFCDPMDCSPPGSSVHGILPAKILEYVVISSSRGSCQPRDWTHAFCIGSGFFTPEPLGRPTLLVPYCKDIVGQWCSVFWHQGLVSMDHDGGNRFRMIQVYYIYCVLYFYYYDISSTSDHQALDPGGWGPLF